MTGVIRIIFNVIFFRNCAILFFFNMAMNERSNCLEAVETIFGDLCTKINGRIWLGYKWVINTWLLAIHIWSIDTEEETCLFLKHVGQ